MNSPYSTTYTIVSFMTYYSGFFIESYEILTARESIASVRARTQAPPEEEDYYESVEDDVSLLSVLI